MTYDIREKAIGAALSCYMDTIQTYEDGPNETAFRAAISAYEKALWRPIEEAPAEESVLITWLIPDQPCSSINTYVAKKSKESGRWICYMDQIEDPYAPITPNYFMPLPASPEVG